MKMPSYKLTYFDTKARGELIRLLLVASGEKFEDKRITREEWASLKSSTPFGQIPILEVDGKTLAQSSAIARYIAKQHGLMGGNAWEEALIDSFNESICDLMLAGYHVKFRLKNDEAAQKVEGEKFKNETVPNGLKSMEKFIGQHGSNGHVVGNKLTLADLSLFCIADMTRDMKMVDDNCFDAYPNVKKVVETVRKDDKIAAYLKSNSA